MEVDNGFDRKSEAFSAREDRLYGRNCSTACGSTRLSRIVRNRRTVGAGGGKRVGGGVIIRSFISLRIVWGCPLFLSFASTGRNPPLPQPPRGKLGPRVPRPDIHASALVDSARNGSIECEKGKDFLISYRKFILCLNSSRVQTCKNRDQRLKKLPDFFELKIRRKEKFEFRTRREEKRKKKRKKKSTFLLPAASDPAFILSSSRVHSLYAPLLLACARESPRRWRKRERKSESGRRGRDVEAESYLVKNRLRAAHLVPFARTTSGLMHSARWKRASVCAPLGRCRRRRRRLGSSPATGLEESDRSPRTSCVPRGGRSSSSILTVRPRFLSAGVATRKRDQKREREKLGEDTAVQVWSLNPLNRHK